MHRRATLFTAMGIALAIPAAWASTPQGAAATPRLEVALVPAQTNPASPQMGDRLSYRTSIRNVGDSSADGVVAWLGLIQVDKGQEQPVDLEDWSAHKAITLNSLAPGEAVQTDWPMRLIASGHYRVVVSAASAGGGPLTPSSFIDLAVRAKPVVESGRVLPVALGMPMLLLAGLLTQRRRRWGVTE